MSKLLTLLDIQDILVDPVTKDPLVLDNDFLFNSKLNQKFPLNGSRSPLLFPSDILPYCKNNGLDWVELIKTKNALHQYFGISFIKWDGADHNSSPDNDCYKKYLQDFKKLVSSANGMLLDIGCDDPQNTINHFPDSISYLGIDPLYYLPSVSFKIFSVAEFLPFSNQSFDCVCFGTSLDHTFDPFSALAEANRVLKSTGSLYLSTLIWHNNAQLYRDHVHFHHFRESEIFNLLKENNFAIKTLFKRPWKNNTHREGLFLEAVKL